MMRATNINKPEAAACHKTRGAVAIEMALVLPILIMLLFGIVEFGRAYNAKLTLGNAAREAAREFVITGDEGLVEAIVTNLETTLSAVTLDVIDMCSDPQPRVLVTAESEFTYNIPLIASGTMDLSESVVMRCNG